MIIEDERGEVQKQIDKLVEKRKVVLGHATELTQELKALRVQHSRLSPSSAAALERSTVRARKERNLRGMYQLIALKALVMLGYDDERIAGILRVKEKAVAKLVRNLEFRESMDGAWLKEYMPRNVSD
jgi:hypothetical protein